MHNKTQLLVVQRPVRGSRHLHCITILLMWLAAACGPDAGPLKAQAPAASTDTLPSVLATVGGEKITIADVRGRHGDELDQLDMQYQRARYKIVEAGLQEMLRERVLAVEAKKQGKTIEQLIAAEGGATLEPTAADVSAWYAANQGRLGGRTLDQLSSQIADYLRQQRRDEAAARLMKKFGKDQNVVVNLPPFRVALNSAQAPVRGGKDARVTVVVFADFQCPFCSQLEPTLKRIEQQFGQNIKLVYRQFPIPQLHPFAFKAAEASLCAHEQSKFWELHDLMYQEQSKLAVTELKEKARRIGLDSKRFDACLDSGRYVEQVQNDVKEGNRVGITGTPALFVNGIALEPGALPYDAIAAVIQKELERTKN